MTSPTSHTVVRGDTLSGIAKHYKKSTQYLIQINQLKNPGLLNIGQVIYLEPQATPNTLQLMFMDWLRTPIEGIKAKLKVDGKEHFFQSTASGLLPILNVEKIGSNVEVWVQNARDEWKKIGETVTSTGQQWMNLVSPSIKLTQALMPHDPQEAQKPFKPAYSKDKPHDGKAKGTPVKEGSPVHETKSTAHNTIELSVDIPQDLIEYFKGYKDEPIAEEDWKKARDLLGCDVNVLKAFAKVESGGRPAYWRLKKDGNVYVPYILYERHLFSRLTKHQYDNVNPDVSWPHAYVRATKKVGGQKVSSIGMTNEQVQGFLGDNKPHAYTHDNRVDEAQDTYNGNTYLRLLNAYRLDKDAALKACSWGKLQILGGNHTICGKEKISEFVKIMCSGEKGQLALLTAFINNNPAAPIRDAHKKIIGWHKTLHQAVKDKDWRMMAYYYNGPGYEEGSYHVKLEAAYNGYQKAGA